MNNKGKAIKKATESNISKIQESLNRLKNLMNPNTEKSINLNNSQNITKNSLYTTNNINKTNIPNTNVQSMNQSYMSFYTNRKPFNNNNISEIIEKNNLTLNDYTKNIKSKWKCYKCSALNNSNNNYCSKCKTRKAVLDKKLNLKYSDNKKTDNNTDNNTSKIEVEQRQLNDLYNYGDYLSKELKESNDENYKLLENYKNISKEYHDKNEENTLISEKLEKIKNEQNILNQANKELKNNYENIQQIIQTNSINNKNNITNLENIINENNNKITQLQSENENLENIQNNYDNEINELQKVLDNLEKENIEKKFEESEIGKKLISENKTTNKQLKEECDEINIRNKFLQNEIDKFNDENNVNELIELLNNNEDILIKYQNNELKDIIIIIEKEIYNNKIKYNSNIEKINDLSNKLQEKELNLVDLQNDIKKINDDVIILKTKAKIKKIKKENIEKTKELNELNDVISNLSMVREKIISENKTEIEKLNEICEKKQKEANNQSFDEETKNLIEDNKNLEKINSNMVNELKDLEKMSKEYEELLQENNKLKREIQGFNK